MYACVANGFRVITKIGKQQQHYRKREQIRYFNISLIINILTLLRADAKSAVLLRVPSSTKVKVRNFPLLHLPRWLCLVDEQLAMSLPCEKAGPMQIPMFMCLRYSTMVSFILSTTFSVMEIRLLKEIQLSVNCCVSILNFYQTAKTTTVLYIYRIWSNAPKPF